MELSLDEIVQIARMVPGEVAAYQVDEGLTRLYASAHVADPDGLSSEGYEGERGNDALKNVVPAYRGRVLDRIGECLKSGEDIDLTYRVITHEAEPVWLHSKARHIGEFEGKPVLLCTIVNASHENEQQKRLVEYSDNPIYVIDSTTFEIIYMNRACKELFGGLEPEAGQTCHDYKHGLDAPCPWCPVSTMDGDTAELDEFYNESTKRWHRYNLHRLTWFGAPAIAVYAVDITDHKNEMAELENSRKMYQGAVQTARLVLWEYDIVNHTIMMSDDEHTEGDYPKFGFSHTMEDAPTSLIPFIDEADVPVLLDMYRKVDAGEDTSCELWYKRRPGHEPRCERVTYTVERDDDGNPVRAHGIGQNITAEKKVEERYARETEMLRCGIAENMVAKSHSNLTKNRFIERESIDGMPAPVPEGSTYDEMVEAFIGIVDKTTSTVPLAKLLSRKYLMSQYERGETHLEFSYRWALNGKVPLWSTTVIHTYMMPATGDLESFSYTYDITDKMIEHQIVNSLTDLGYSQLGFIYPDTGSFTLFTTIGKGTAMRSSGGYESVMDEFISRASFNPDQAAHIREASRLKNVVAALEHMRIYSFTSTTTDKDGRERQRIARFMYSDERRDALFFCLSDITDQHEEEIRQINALKEAKLETDKANEAKSSFLSSMSHDIRTPLNGIIGFTDLAIKEKDPVKMQTYLGRIRSSSALLLDLVNDTLELSRIESGKMTLEPEPVEPYTLSAEVITALKPTADLKKVHIEVEPSILPETVSIDPLKYQKILLNLLSNAIKYTPEGGTVTFLSESIDPPVDGHNRRIVIADTGIGMSEEFQTHMFEPFSQEKRSDTDTALGTGLGLAIVKRIVDIMGGSISVESAVGKGTRFTIDLYFEKVGDAKETIKEEELGVASLAGKRVLLCEDNSLNAEIARILLEEKDVKVDLAADGSEGLSMFSDSAPGEYDAILMDVRMPVMDGREATAAIRRLDHPDARKVPIIALSADAFQEDIKSNIEAGMDAYIVKPIAPDMLYGVLSRSIEAGSTADDRPASIDI